MFNKRMNDILILLILNIIRNIPDLHISNQLYNKNSQLIFRNKKIQNCF